MPETSGDLSTFGENNMLGPDYFGFYRSEVKELLSQDDGLLPFAHSDGNLHGVGRGKGSTTKNNSRTQENNATIGSFALFSNGIGAMLSESKKERLKLLLRQSIFTLAKEVDEMINPILSVCRIRSCLRCKESLLSSDITCKVDPSKQRQKKQKALPTSQDLERENMQLNKPRKVLSDVVVKKCIECLATSTPQWRPAPDGEMSLCNACGLRYTKALKNGSIKNTNIEGGKETVELDDDLRIILENESTKVEELMESHCSEIFATLNHMEQNLEELLNTSMTSCRAMTPAEKQQLRELIKKLPPRNLDRVAEIVELDKSSNEVHVELDQMDNVTLWRLYFYVATIQAANSI